MWERHRRMPMLAGEGGDSSPRVRELDSLRALGALTIVGFHLRPGAFFFGWTRADLFFVISGYLITQIINRHVSRPGFLLRFWARRALRTWPAYHLMLAILVIMAWVHGEALSAAGLVSHATFTQNLPYYWSGHVPGFAPAAIQTWSLAIEEQFYLICPLLVVLSGRWMLVPAAFWLVATSVVMRLEGVFPAVALARGDGLALGSILALALNRWAACRPACPSSPAASGLATLPWPPAIEACPGNEAAARPARLTGPRRPWLPSAILIAAGAIGFFFVSGPLPRGEEPIPGVCGCGPWSILAVNVIYTSLVGLVVLHTGHRLLAPLRWPPLLYIGRISYGIYLYNLLIIESVHRYFGSGSVAVDLAAAGFSILAGAISWELLEKPVGKLKRWFPYPDSEPRFEVPASTYRDPGPGLQIPESVGQTTHSGRCPAEVPA